MYHAGGFPVRIDQGYRCRKRGKDAVTKKEYIVCTHQKQCLDKGVWKKQREKTFSAMVRDKRAVGFFREPESQISVVVFDTSDNGWEGS